MSKIKLNSGILWDFLNPKVEDVDIHDIMHNLCKEQRFNNCLDQKWSVLDHSLLVYMLVKLAGGTNKQMYVALLHDTPEAYFKDLPTPLKGLLRDYQKYYFRTETVLEVKFGVTLHPLDDMVKLADRTAMLIEDLLFSNSNSNWHDFTYQNYVDLNTAFNNKIHEAIYEISTQAHYNRKQRFFKVFKELQKRIGKDHYDSTN